MQQHWKPTLQTKFGPIEGNCLAACIATMFPVAIDDVPDFDGDDWLMELSSWATRSIEMFVLTLKFTPEDFKTAIRLFQAQRIITSIDSGSDRHAVITKDLRVIFDPRIGLLNDRELIAKDNPTFFIFSPLNVG